MSTSIKHKQRSRRVWQNNASTRRSVFNVSDARAALLIRSKMLKKENQ